MSNSLKNCDSQAMGSEPLRRQFRNISRVQFGPSWHSLQPSSKVWDWICRQTCFHSFHRCPCSSTVTKEFVRPLHGGPVCSSQTFTQPLNKLINGLDLFPDRVLSTSANNTWNQTAKTARWPGSAVSRLRRNHCCDPPFHSLLRRDRKPPTRAHHQEKNQLCRS